MYIPHVLRGTANFVSRDSLLFCYCPCQQQLTWVPQGGARFKASHCNMVFEAEPEDINLKRYVVMARETDMGNVRPLFRQKAERMTFA